MAFGDSNDNVMESRLMQQRSGRLHINPKDQKNLLTQTRKYKPKSRTLNQAKARLGKKNTNRSSLRR